MSNRAFLDFAWSTHPVATTAVGEIVADIREHRHDRADVMFVFVTRPFAGILEDIAPALKKLLSPQVLIGCAARQIFDPDGWLEDQAAIGVLVINRGEVQVHRFNDGESVALPNDAPSIVIAAPNMAAPQAGMIAGGRTSGEPMILDDHLYIDGAVAVTFSADSDAEIRQRIDENVEAILRFEDAILDENEREEWPYSSGFASSRPFENSLTVFTAKSTSESRRG